MKAITALLVSIILFTACKKSDNSTSYSGTWNVAYVSNSINRDTGTAVMVVSTDGSVKGTALSKTYNQTYLLTGTVISGQLNVASGSSSTTGATFTGYFGASTGLGTWTNNTIANKPYSGTWTSTKQ